MHAKKTLTVLVLAAGFAGAAFAETPDPAGQFAATSGGAQRTEVKAELVQYQKAGVNPWATSYNQLSQFHSVANRQDVTAEYLASRDEVKALTSEDSGSAYLAHQHAPAAGNTHMAFAR